MFEQLERGVITSLVIISSSFLFLSVYFVTFHVVINRLDIIQSQVSIDFPILSALLLPCSHKEFIIFIHLDFLHV